MTTASDGYGVNQFKRDTSDCSGGTKGHVNTNLYCYSIAGKDVKAFEWNILSVLDSYSTEGENVAVYGQANKLGQGPVWAGCFEACDLEEDTKSGLVALEVDCWVTGKDNGLRYGIDVVVGDSKKMRNKGQSDVVEATAGIRVGASNVAPNAKWSKGVVLEGKMDTGIDLSNLDCKEPIKLPNGKVLGKPEPLLYVALGASMAALLLHFI